MLFGIALWCLAEALFRRSFSAVLGVDDAEPLLLAQDIQWLHHPHRPPFYYWLTWLFAQFNGYNLDTVLLVKYSTIAAALVLFYAIARRLLQRWQGAVAALLGLTFLYDTGFNPHLNLAHTLGLWLTVTLAFWLMLRAGERPSLQNFVLLGLALGLGLLSKPSFLAVVPCLLLAGLLSPRLPGLRRWPKLALAVAIMAAIYLPYLWLNQQQDEGLIGTAAANVAPEIRSGDWHVLLLARLEGFERIARFTLLFLLPFLVLWLALFARGPWLHGLRSPTLRPILLFTLFSMALLVLANVAIGLSELKQRYMLPYLLFVPILAFGTLESVGRGIRFASTAGRLYIAAAAVAFLGTLAFQHYYLTTSPTDCGRCRWQQPYSELADWVAAQGYREGTLVAGDEWVGGHVLVRLPGFRVLTVGYPFWHAGAPPPGRQGSCLLIWEPAKLRGKAREMARIVADVYGEEVPQVAPQAVTLAFAGSPETQHRYFWAELPPAGDCR